jgi:mono/diheme cytochrome c family protein
MHAARVGSTIVALCGAAVATAWGQQPAAAPAAAQEPITPALVARGDSIFHGQAAGGLCFGCHGMDGKGVPGVAPDLTAGKWLHGDGSFSAIMATVERGVPKPKQAAAPMPPMGGAQLGPADIRAVAAYVYSLTHPVKPTGR